MNATNQIRDARERAGLTQQALAQLAGVPQPNLSAYESGKVVPREETLARVLAATAELPSRVLRRERDRVLEAVARRRASDPRVFGSVANGTERPDSDIDLLVTFDEKASLLDAAGLVLDLEAILGRHVDVMSYRSEGAIRDRAVAEAIAL